MSKFSVVDLFRRFFKRDAENLICVLDKWSIIVSIFHYCALYELKSEEFYNKFRNAIKMCRKKFLLAKIQIV